MTVLMPAENTTALILSDMVLTYTFVTLLLMKRQILFCLLVILLLAGCRAKGPRTYRHALAYPGAHSHPNLHPVDPTLTLTATSTETPPPARHPTETVTPTPS